ncbi:MAG: low molecular weight phosphatase family protein [Candidatus Woesearchaeota archaeon]
MIKILFICYGNIARSQMAEAFYNKYTSSEDAKSAGVGYNIASRYKHPTEDVVKVMLEQDIDITKKTAKALTKEMVDDSEKIIILCELTDCPKYLLDSRKFEHIPIADPYGIDINYTRSVRDEIKKMVLELIHLY